MPERRRTRTTGGQVKAKRLTAQTTLKDLFQRTNSGITSTGKEQGLHKDHTDPVAPFLRAADPQSPVQPSRVPKQNQLFPIFTKALSVRERPREIVTDLDGTEVVDITDLSSDTEVSSEPPVLSSHRLSPHSEFGQATSHSPCLSPNIQCGSDTNFPHDGTHDHAPSHEMNKKSLDKRTPGLGDVPLPGSCSQHVRGTQHCYTSSQTPRRRRVYPSFSSSDEGTSDFLTKWLWLGDALSGSPDHIRRSLTPQQCEEHLQSLGRDCAKAHPASAQISVRRERIPSRHAEIWTRRFRPRCASEVLGNERHALYLRDWLRALELQLEARQPEEPASKGAKEIKEKSTSKRAEPRGAKRPHVVRAVAKKRSVKRRRVDSDDDLDDFVVLSDADEEQVDDLPEDSEDEFAFCQRTLTRLHRRDTTNTQDAHPVVSDDLGAEIKHTTTQIQEPAQPDFADKLTNTLLITGPPGCGKTAAVYACAEELGWEIFEVYPGIGRRNGASLDHLVGDIGKNHIVQTVRRCMATKTTTQEVKKCMGLRGYLAEKKTGDFAGFGESQEAGTEAQPIDIEGDSPRHELQPLPPDQEKGSSDEAANSGKCHADSSGSKPIVRQSLVLLEEVDILFKEDAGFWPAVVDFIRCCQRPVVMTCNDPGLVPLADLPLQTVLVFEPCPSTVAATFLQCVSLTEGCLVPHEDLMVLYESTRSIDGLDVPDAAVYPRTEPVPLPDLRRSITELQMLCAGARHGSASEMHQGDEAEGHVRRSARPISAASRVAPMGSRVESEWWRKMKRQSEVMSHVDAELCRVPMGRGEVVSDEEEVGYMVLEEREGPVFWERDELMAKEAIRHARGLHEDGTGPSTASINPAARLDARGFRARVEHRSRMVEALQDVLAPPAPLMPQRSVFLDYIPWVREMVLVDDELERRALGGRGGGRCTRNSLRTVHARNVLVGEEARAVLRDSRYEDM